MQAIQKKPKSHSERALEYFDDYYKPVYEDKWPSIRISLLSRHKYCALANNFSDIEETVTELISSDGNDMLEIAANTLSCDFTKDRYSRVVRVNPSSKSKTKENMTETTDVSKEYENIPGVITPGSNVYDFMPPTRVLSGSEEQEEEEIEHGFYRPKALNVNIVPCKPLKFPRHLKVFVHDRGEIELFPPIKRDTSGKLCESCLILLV